MASFDAVDRQRRTAGASRVKKWGRRDERAWGQAAGVALQSRIVDLPEHLIDDVLHGDAVEVDGVERWLVTGEGDPSQTTSDA